MTYTAEQKREYFAQLRKEWQSAKAASQGNGEIEAIYKHLQKMGIRNLSPVNIQLVYMQAEAVGFEGMPYVDFKTYQEWRKTGYQVRKGEKSQVHTITWVGPGRNGDDGESDKPAYLFPKLTNLFHSSQVDPIIA